MGLSKPQAVLFDAGIVYGYVGSLSLIWMVVLARELNLKQMEHKQNFVQWMVQQLIF